MFQNVLSIHSACSCGKKHPLLTKECVVSKEAALAMRDYIAANNFRRPLIVADENTVVFAENLLARFPAAKAVVDGHAHATEVYVAEVESVIDAEKPDVLIACGSGSVHDIIRYCAKEKELPFLSYPTAASVDGFVSGVAAMTWHGQKLTFPSVPPLACFADPEVFSSAPERLTASGVGDVLGKWVSLFDWRVGQILTGEPVCEEIFALEAEAVSEAADAVRSRSVMSREAYTEKIMNALLISGLAIQLNETSRPASGAEHHLSHLWEMHRINEKNDGLHGEQVAVGMLAAVRRYDAELSKGIDYEKLASPDLAKTMCREDLLPVFRELTDGILRENLPDGTLASSSLAKIRVTGDTDERIRRAAEEVPKPEEIEALLRAAGTPTSPADIGLDDSPEFIVKSLRYAPYVRNRLTLLKALTAAKKL